jgi:hypothetical protein
MSTRDRLTLLKTIVDTTSSATYTYIGTSEQGQLESAAAWTVMRIDKTNGALIEYANSGEPDQVWNDRVSLTYT